MIDKSRQVLFSIIQMDPGSESMLGWCKNNALNRLRNEYNGAERVGFRSIGSVGDIYYNVKVDGAQGGNVFVKISLSLVQDVSAYFGYASAVEMRCRCRRVVLAQTAVTAVSNVLISSSGTNPNIYTYEIRLNTTVIATYNGSIQFSTDGTNNTYAYSNVDIEGPDDYGGAYDAYSTWVSGLGGATKTQQLGVFSGTIITNMGNVAVSGAGAWQDTVPSYEDVIAGMPPNDRERSGVFLTDGMELGSYPITTFQTGSPLIDAQRGMFDTDTWYGGDYVYVDENFIKDAFNNLGRRKLSVIGIAVPEDACSAYTTPGTMTTEMTNISTGKQIMFYPSSSVGARFTVYKEYTYAWSSVIGTLTDEEKAEVNAFIDSFIIPSQNAAKTREYDRRKKCSDGMLTYLRNGFLPPEFEYHIKTTAPKSALLRRKTLMEIVSRSQEIVTAEVDAEGVTYQTNTATVTLRYSIAEETFEKTFVGTARVGYVTHYTTEDVPTLETRTYTYTNFPMLVNSAAGKAYPLPSPLLSLPYATNLKLKTVSALWHDDNTYPLFVEANGTFNYNPAWLENNTYGTATYAPTIAGTNITDLVPIPQKTSDNLTFTHPQFLLDYIAASKPVEAKTPDVPSTNWLSSRLIDGETITIVPLSFINAAGEDIGMFPLSVTDEVPAQLKVTGYAKTRFKYADSSFTEPVWTELDAPVFFNYQAAWSTKNCVCIGSKNPWTDTKTAARTQGKHIGDTPPDDYTLTNEEKLYHEVKKALSAK